MRQRSETIGTLGRAPARSGRLPSTPLPMPPRAPRDPDPVDGAVRGWLRSALLDNVGLKFLSLVLAITVSLLVNTDRDSEIVARVGVSYTLPTDRVLVSDRLEEVQITIRGRSRRLRRFDDKHDIDRINLDLRNQHSGEIELTPSMIHLPAGLTVASILPHSTRVVFERPVDKLVEVAPVVAGHARHGYLVSDIKAVPATVKVRGAETMLGALSAIKTREIRLDDRADSFSTDADLVLPAGVELVGDVSKVQVQAHVDEELVSRRFGDLAVAIRGDGVDLARWSIAPARVEVTLTGALLAIERAHDNLTAVVKVTAADSKAREADVVIEGLPPGVGAKVSPERVKLTPVAR